MPSATSPRWSTASRPPTPSATQVSYLQTTTFSFSMQVVVQRYVSVSVAGQSPSAPSLNVQA
mgnify:CR=1 FL=1